MFINKSKNKSGTTSVRILEKRGRNNVLVKSMGSSRDEKEIDRMVEQAKAFIKQRTGSLYNLFNPPENPSADEIISDISNSQISVVGPEVVFGKLFDHVGYGEVGGLFRPLVLSYTKQGHAKPSKIMLRMDDEQTELVNIVSNWVNRNFG